MYLGEGQLVELGQDIYNEPASCYDNTKYSIVLCELFFGYDYPTLADLNKAVIEHYKKAHPETDITKIIGFVPKEGE